FPNSGARPKVIEVHHHMPETNGGQTADGVAVIAGGKIAQCTRAGGTTPVRLSQRETAWSPGPLKADMTYPIAIPCGRFGTIRRVHKLTVQNCTGVAPVDAAKQIVDHYERNALSWDADRRAAIWIDKPYIERFLNFLPQAATVLDLGCGGGSPVARHMAAQGF